MSDLLRTTDTGTRTGVPFLYPYEYKGTGTDTLTGGLTARQLDAIARGATGLAGLEGYRRPSRAKPQPECRERPARAVAREEAPEPARAPSGAGLAAWQGKPPATSKDELEANAADCRKCKGAKAGPWGQRGGIITCPACNGNGAAEAVAGRRPPEHRATPEREAARAETPAPERCPKCQYLTMAIGHKIACGDGAR